MGTLREESLQFMRELADLGSLRKRHLSQHFDVSDNELCVLMNNEGFKYRDVLAEARLERLQQLLASEPEIKTSAIYPALGFKSHHTFYRFFEKYTGASWYQARKAGWPAPDWDQDFMANNRGQ